MKWSDALSVVAKIAPSIAAAAAGPLAGSAVNAIEYALGLESGGTLEKRQEAAAAAVTGASPDTLLALKKADQDFQAHMTELGFESVAALEKLANEDRQGARARETAVRDWTPRVLASGVTAGFFGILGYMAVCAVPASSKDMLNIMLGSLGAAWVSIVSYYFGSSSESSKKTDLLAQK
jgi:hypothetical protein